MTIDLKSEANTCRILVPTCKRSRIDQRADLLVAHAQLNTTPSWHGSGSVRLAFG